MSRGKSGEWSAKKLKSLAFIAGDGKTALLSSKGPQLRFQNPPKSPQDWQTLEELTVDAGHAQLSRWGWATRRAIEAKRDRK